ncbi:MAG TPA: alpha/beta hydrolase [Syntrophorhabdaceae bacterium]|nr:alpha/beta hydrolase [Syntrophorhabdaceae bacterium]HOT42158.1 alpha/beta hydrolase [Syntrophorhabdaceae bacterium]HPC67320.1 alpha/beta hydrolase [Syntrophorhabdaceae bacterium]HQE80443.1 alpha/beta hydrolase [Syntrophorhabdaceae bacterium]HQH42883.1 alpha/beta hydrolase [Syntrophorhabdaceae bacterium]
MTLNIERYGNGEKVVFIHGSGLNTRIWHRQRDYLVRSMEVVLLDLPGHGMSPGDGCESVEGYREAVFNAIREAGIEHCYIAGHSLGGAIAMSFAISYPDITKGLILIGTGARLRVLPQILHGILNDKDKTIKQIIRFAFSDKSEKGLIDEHLNETSKCPPEIIYRDFYACDCFNLMDSLDLIKSPVLIICGKDDNLTPPKYAEYLKSHIRSSELVIIEDAGHMVMLEKPESVNAEIEKFLKKHTL